MYLKALAALKDILFMEEPLVLMKISPVEPINPLGALQLSVLLHMLIYSHDSVKKGDWEGENKRVLHRAARPVCHAQPFVCCVITWRTNNPSLALFLLLSPLCM